MIYQNLSLIVAFDLSKAIGKSNTIPWHLSNDMKHFKECTMGKTIIMGRNTFASLNYKCLPGRNSVVISSDSELHLKYNVEVHSTLESAIEAHRSEDEVFIIGGGMIYKSALPLVKKIYATEVNTIIEGADTFFSNIPEDFKELDKTSHVSDEKNEFSYSFITYTR